MAVAWTYKVHRVRMPMHPCEENTQYFCTWFLSDLYVKRARSCYSQAIWGDQKRHGPAQYLFYVFQIITFYADHSWACEQSPIELTAGKEIEGRWQLLMFGSRNWRTKSRKKCNYAPHVANSWLHHWPMVLVYEPTCCHSILKHYRQTTTVQ